MKITVVSDAGSIISSSTVYTGRKSISNTSMYSGKVVSFFYFKNNCIKIV